MASVLEVPYQIAMALTLAANVTGADYDYLVKTAARESNFEARASAKTSSARGLFQFIEETWLRTLKEDGPALGLGDVAAKIFRTRNGRYYVPNKAERKKVLDLRNDPKVSALLAGAYTKRNAEVLTEGIGRKPTAGELYMAHFLGAGDAIRMVRLARAHPNRRADRSFPAPAKANKRIFFDGERPRTLRQVYRLLTHKYDNQGRRARPTSHRSWNTMVVKRLPYAENSPYVRKAAVKKFGKRLDPKTLPLPLRKNIVLPLVRKNFGGERGAAPVAAKHLRTSLPFDTAAAQIRGPVLGDAGGGGAGPLSFRAAFN